MPGKIIEASYFGYELNNKPNPDFEKVGAEVKSTPADMSKKDKKYKSGETISITQIDFSNPIEDDFKKSHLYRKLIMLIVIFYYRNRSLDSIFDYKVFYATLFQPTEKDLLIIQQDYKEIVSKIKSANADKLSRSDGIYLGTAQKAQKGDLICPYYGGAEIVRRTFTLKKDYVNIILDGYYKKHNKEEEIVKDVSELKSKSFSEILIEKFDKYKNRDINDIASAVNLIKKGEKININKSTLPKLTARMLGLKKLKSEELIKSGIAIKTIRFDNKGNNKEQFRLGDVSFAEIANKHAVPYKEMVANDDGICEEVEICDWEESDLYKQLADLKYLFVVFQANSSGDYIFKGVKLWGMSEIDIELAHLDWLDIKKVIDDGVKFVRINDKKTLNNLPGMKVARRIHVRPHADKSYYVDFDGKSWGNGKLSDTDVLPDGRRMTRQSYWLSNKFVASLVSDLID